MSHRPLRRSSRRRTAVDPDQSLLSSFRTAKPRSRVVPKSSFKVYEDSPEKPALTSSPNESVRDASSEEIEVKSVTPSPLEVESASQEREVESSSPSPPTDSTVLEEAVPSTLPKDLQSQHTPSKESTKPPSEIVETPVRKSNAESDAEGKALPPRSCQLTPSKRKKSRSSPLADTVVTPTSSRVKLRVPRAAGSMGRRRRLLLTPAVVDDEEKVSAVPVGGKAESLASKARELSASLASNTSLSKLKGLLDSPKSKADSSSSSSRSIAAQLLKPKSSSEAVRLPLPLQYSVLMDIFDALETSMSIMRSRNITSVLFSQIKQPVEQICKRRFTVSKLAQILHVFSDGYEVDKRYVVSTGGRGAYELCLSLQQGSDAADQYATAWQRKKLFRQRILDIVHAHHQSFLSTLPVPVSMDRSSLRAWHIGFQLELVPAIPEATLPSLTPSTSAIVARIRSNAEARAKPINESSVSVSVSTSASVRRSLKNVPARLLAKVLAKEASNDEHTRRVGTEADQERRRLRAQLPELLPLIRSVFMSTKRSVMVEDELLKMLMSRSRGSLREKSLPEQLKLIMEELPDWCCKKRVGRFDAISLKTKMNVAELQKRLRESHGNSS